MLEIPTQPYKSLGSFMLTLLSTQTSLTACPGLNIGAHPHLHLQRPSPKLRNRLRKPGTLGELMSALTRNVQELSDLAEADEVELLPRHNVSLLLTCDGNLVS
jgi:hypothetical protein